MQSTQMARSRPAWFRFSLRHSLAATTVACLLLAPVGWYGGAYLFSVSLSALVVVGCAWAYSHDRSGFMLGIAVSSVLFGFLSMQLVFCFHALLNVVACGALATLKVRPRNFAVTLGALAFAVYGAVMFNGLARLGEFAALRAKYQFESLDERLKFERVESLKDAQSQIPPEVKREPSPAVLARLVELEESGQRDFSRRTWALRELHENSTRHFAAASGFGVMRMRTIQPRMIEIEPRAMVAVPLELGDLSLEPAREELVNVHKTAIFDFVASERLGYFRSRDEVAGFEAHGFDKLKVQLHGCADSSPRWRVARLELVSVLRHSPPQVYISESLPVMDELEILPRRDLNEFERRSLAKLHLEEDLEIEEVGDAIVMLGAIRAANQCLNCHEGQRGTLLGAFSYELTQVPEEPRSSAEGALISLPP